MSLEWKTVEIRSIADVTMGQSPKSEFYNEDLEGMPFLQGNKTFGDKYPSFELYTTSLKKVAKKGTVLMSVRAPVGDLNIATEDICIGRGVCSLKMKKGDSEFLYYLLKANISSLINRESGTVFGSVNKNDIESFEVKIPKDLEVQNKILTILKNIDEKIRVCKELNHNLMSMADSIFQEKFCNFSHYDENELNYSDFGYIPENWKYKTLDEISEVTIGKTPPRKEKEWFSEIDGIKWVSIKDLGSSGTYIFDTTEYLTKEAVEKFNVNIVPKDTVILSFKLTVGRISITTEDMVTNEAIAHFKLNDYTNISKEYLYLYLKNFNYETLGSTSSIAKAINSKIVKKIPVLIPKEEDLEWFARNMENLFNTIKNNQIEINNLTKIRDTLLPKLMSGEIDVSEVNCDLKILINTFIFNFLYYLMEVNHMKTKIISKIQNQMKPFLNQGQYLKLTNSLLNSLKDIEILDNNNDENEIDNLKLLTSFLSAKQVEGRSEKTIAYYRSTLEKMLTKINKQVYNITTDEIRKYLYDYKKEKNSSKITIDNMRRIFSSFFSWLEDEDYILKNPVRRIHRVKTGRVVKEVLTDENLEILRDNCEEIRDLAIVEILISTGIRVGELVRLNIADINFYERECVVFGKGESERVVYFDARTKIHLIEYLESRTDENPALFVSLNKPYERLGISGAETRLRELGNKCNIPKVHPHKFRRTLATNAIDKGMPIEQVQKLLGHVQIDTTMQYAMVNQSNVKIAHRKYIS